MKVLSSEEIDICVSKGEKVFRFGKKNDHDKLPVSVLKQMKSVDI